MEILLFRADRRTDTTSPAVAFRNSFVNVPKNKPYTYPI